MATTREKGGDQEEDKEEGCSQPPQLRPSLFRLLGSRISSLPYVSQHPHE